MSLIGKHTRISENLGWLHVLHIDWHFLVEFDMADFSKYCHIVDIHQYNFCDKAT